MANDRPRKRRRPAKSCQQCRRRKVRCDRNFPCGPCSCLQTPIVCSYRDSPSSHIDQTSSHSTSALNHEDIVTPANFALHEASRNNPTPASLEVPGLGNQRPHPLPDSPLQSGSAFGDLQRRLQRLEDSLLTRNDNRSSDSSNRTVEYVLQDISRRLHKIEDRILSPEATKSNGLTIALPAPRMHASTGKMKVLGPTHYIHVLEKLQFADPFKEKNPEPSYPELQSELRTLIMKCRNIRESIKSQQAVQLTDLFSDLRHTIPAKSVCDELINCYLRTFELIYRVIHIPSFWEEYLQFWDPSQPQSPLFLIKLVLILAIGTTFHPQRGKTGPDYDIHLIQTWIYAAQWWLAGPSEKSAVGIGGLQVFCLLIVARKACSLGTSPWLSTGPLISMATVMGLQHDSTTFPSLSVFQSEMRTRLWITILELTAQSCLDTATQSFISLDSVYRMPLNIEDKDMSPDCQSLPTPKPSREFTETSLQCLLYESLLLRGQVIKLLTPNCNTSYPDVLKLSSELQRARKRMADFFQANQTHQGILNPTKFHQRYLDITLHRYILLLHQPFTLASRTNPQYYFSRKASLESAMAIASYADTVNLEHSTSTTTELDDLGRLSITGSASFKGPLNLDIISTLGFELITQLEEDKQTGPPSDLTKLARGPILQTLEHILTQLLQIITLGTPSMKRYSFLSALLACIHALEDDNKCVQRTVYERLKQTLGECYDILRNFSSSANLQQDPPLPTRPLPGGEILSAVDTNNTSMNFGLSTFDADMEPIFDLDIPSLLGLADLYDINENHQ